MCITEPPLYTNVILQAERNAREDYTEANKCSEEEEQGEKSGEEKEQGEKSGEEKEQGEKSGEEEEQEDRGDQEQRHQGMGGRGTGGRGSGRMSTELREGWAGDWWSWKGLYEHCESREGKGRAKVSKHSH